MNTDLEKISEIFKALGDPTRLRLIRLLASQMIEKISVVELARKLEISQPSASQHIKVLKNLNLLLAKKERPYIYYYINLTEFHRQKEILTRLFNLALTQCVEGGNCETCQFRNGCNEKGK